MEQLPKKRLEFLAPLDSSGWLAEQSAELKNWFAANGEWRNFHAGQSLFRTGDEADGMYGLGFGAMDIEYYPESLESFVVIRALPGSWMGQEALLSGKKRPIGLIAPIDSRFYFVSRKKLIGLLAERPDFWPAFYALVLQHALYATEFLCEALSLLPVTRLARLLLRLSENTVEVVASQQDLSVMLGIPRSSLRRALSALTEVGVITTGYGRIFVQDRATLQTFSQSS